MKQHVLFDDDDPSFLDGLRRMVHDQRGRWEMTFVTSGDDAVECVETRTVDTIVFADMICFTSPCMTSARSAFQTTSSCSRAH